MPFERCHLSQILRKENKLSFRNSLTVCWPKTNPKLTYFQWLERRQLVKSSVVILILDSTHPNRLPIRISPRNLHSSPVNKLVLQRGWWEIDKLSLFVCASRTLTLTYVRHKMHRTLQRQYRYVESISLWCEFEIRMHINFPHAKCIGRQWFDGRIDDIIAECDMHLSWCCTRNCKQKHKTTTKLHKSYVLRQ